MQLIVTIATSVISAILAFILQSVIRENVRLKKDKDEKQNRHDTAIENGVVCILRKHLMDEHEIWVAKGFITSHALESDLAMYKAYKDLGGNGMIDHMEEEIQALPIKD